MEKILALDLSTTTTGFAIGEKNKLEKHGIISSNLKTSIARIVEMRQYISNLIKNNNIQKIVVEEVRPEYNSHTMKILMWLQAAIVIATYEIDKNIEFQFIGASSWRAELKIHQGRGIKRQQLKSEDINYVQKKYNIKVINDDEADAICLFDAYFHRQDNELNWE